MKNILLIFLIFNTLLVFSQEEQVKCNEITLKCLFVHPWELVINNDKEYHQNIRLNNIDNVCSDYSIPEIDFNKFTLIGYSKSVAGCEIPTYSYEFIREENKIILKIQIVTQGSCLRANHIVFWCLIPKLSQNEKVIFKTKIN